MRLLASVVVVIMAIASLSSVAPADVGCCETKQVIPPAPGCFHPSTALECFALDSLAVDELRPFRFVPDAKCDEALQRCIPPFPKLSAGIDGPSQVFPGEIKKLELLMRNLDNITVTLDQARVNLTGPLPGGVTQIPIPINATIPVLGKLFVPLFNGQIPANAPRGTYTFAIDVFGARGNSMKVESLGGGRSTLKIATPSASITDPVGDVRERLTNNPAAPSAYVGEFDATAFNATFGPNGFYGRIDLAGGPVLDRLGPGQTSKGWNALLLGGTCTFAGAIPGVAFVFNIEEEKFNQPGSPMVYKGFRCVNGSYQADLTPIGFRVGSNFVEMFGPVPPGLNLAGQLMQVVVFGFLQGQPPVVDVTPLTPPVTVFPD